MNALTARYQANQDTVQSLMRRRADLLSTNTDQVSEINALRSSNMRMARFAPDVETSRVNFKRLADENIKLQMESNPNRIDNLVNKIKALRRDVRAGMKTD